MSIEPKKYPSELQGHFAVFIEGAIRTSGMVRKASTMYQDRGWPELPLSSLEYNVDYEAVLLPQGEWGTLLNLLHTATLTRKEALSVVFDIALGDVKLATEIKALMDEVLAAHGLCAILNKNGRKADARKVWTQLGNGAQVSASDGSQAAAAADFIPVMPPPGSRSLPEPSGPSR